MSKYKYNKYVVNYFLANAGGQYQGTWPWPNGLNKKNLIAKKDSGIYASKGCCKLSFNNFVSHSTPWSYAIMQSARDNSLGMRSGHTSIYIDCFRKTGNRIDEALAKSVKKLIRV